MGDITKSRDDVLRALNVDPTDLAHAKAKKNSSDKPLNKKERSNVEIAASNALPFYTDTLMPMEQAYDAGLKTTAGAAKDPAKAKLTSTLAEYDKTTPGETAAFDWYADYIGSAEDEELGSLWHSRSVVSDSTQKPVLKVDDAAEEDVSATASSSTLSSFESWLVSAWNKLRGRTDLGEAVDTEIDSIDGEEFASLLPLAARPQLPQEQAVTQQALEKLQVEIQQALYRLSHIEDEVAKLTADDAEAVVKTVVKMGNIQTHDLLQQELVLTGKRQMDGLKQNRSYIKLITDIRGAIAEQIARSDKLGWIGVASVAAFLIANIALCFATGGSSAILQGLALASTLTGGISGIIKAITDYQGSLAQGQLGFYDICRDMNKNQMGVFSSSFKEMMSAIVQYVQNMVRYLKSERDTIESMLS